jgi:putative ABC transport system permease protein
MNIFTLSWKNIIAKPLNTMMSVLLFALSIGLITFLTLLNTQLKKGLDNNLAGIDLVLGAKGSPLQLILNSMYHIDAPTGNIPIEEAGPFLNPKHPLIASAVPLSLGDSYGAYRIAGAPLNILTLYHAAEVQGALYQNDFEVLVGSGVAKKLHMHVGDTFYSTHGLEDNPDLAHDHGTPFTVVGILNPTGTVLDQLILCTPQTVWKVHEHTESSAVEEDHHDEEDHESHNHSAENHVHNTAPTISIDSAAVQMLSDSVIADLRGQPEKEITSILITFKSRTNFQALTLLRNINQNTGLMAASPAIEINRLYAMMGSGTDALRYVAILIAIVAAISIFISLYTSLKERQYEMALMRVGGAGPGMLFRMILGEGFWITMLGLILGILSGHVGMQLAGSLLERGYKYQFTGFFWVNEEWYIIIGAFAVGLCAAILPAIQGSRTDIHKTLAEG